VPFGAACGLRSWWPKDNLLSLGRFSPDLWTRAKRYGAGFQPNSRQLAGAGQRQIGITIRSRQELSNKLRAYLATD
jgi:hypothetical protein